MYPALAGRWRFVAVPETMHLPKVYLAVYGLLMLLGGCVHPRATAPEANSTGTPGPAQPNTPPSAHAPAPESPPQSAASASAAAINATNSSTVPLNDVVSAS